jgi:hypothetical protein
MKIGHELINVIKALRNIIGNFMGKKGTVGIS